MQARLEELERALAAETVDTRVFARVWAEVHAGAVARARQGAAEVFHVLIALLHR